METLSLILYFFLGAVLSANWKKIKNYLPFLSHLQRGPAVMKTRVLEAGQKSTKIVNLLAEHKKGLTLREIAKELGVHYVRLGKDIKSLVGKEKIEKKNGRYFCK